MPPADLDLSKGEGSLGPYRILRPVSAGGMARVYEARLESLAGVTTRVAIKVILPDYAHEQSFKELFISEARLSARLEHQNLVRIQQFNKEGEVYYLVMEYIDGLTFRRIISGCQRNGVRLPVPVIAELGRQVCDGLHYAHTLRSEEGTPLGLVHRDIKPTNLMLNAQGVAKVLDFGISAAHGARDVGEGVKGTWGYMALEQAEQRDVGPQADVFGVAAVLYEMATLSPLFPEKEPAAICEALRSDLAAKRALALGGPYAELGNILVRALQRDPAARHRGAAGLSRVLAALVPDPVGIHDALTRLVRDLRHLEGSSGNTGIVERTRGSTRGSATPGSARPVPPPVAIPIDPPPASVPPVAPPAPRASGAPDPQPVPPAVPVSASPIRRPPAPDASAVPPEGANASGDTRTWALVGGACAVLLLIGMWAMWPESAPEPQPTPVAEPAATAPTLSADIVRRDAKAIEASAATATPRPAPPASIPAPTTPPTQEPPAPTPAPAPATAVPSAPVLSTVQAPAPTTTAATPQRGLVSLGAVPRAQVQINGQYVGDTPLYEFEVPPGTLDITLAASNYRTKRFTLEVTPGAHVKRVWYFAEENWYEQ